MGNNNSSSLIKQNDTLTTKLTTENHNLRTENHNLRTENTKLSTENTKLSTENTKLSTYYKNLMKVLYDLNIDKKIEEINDNTLKKYYLIEII